MYHAIFFKLLELYKACALYSLIVGYFGIYAFYRIKLYRYFYLIYDSFNKTHCGKFN